MPEEKDSRSFLIPIELIKKSPLRVKQYIHPWYKPRPYIRQIEEKIMAAKLAPPGAKVKRRFAIRLAPRAGKTEYVSKALASYLLGNWPDEEGIICSYNSRKALNYSAKIREVFLEPKFQSLFGVRLKPDTRSKERWEIEGHRGGLTAAGFGGAMTGEGADFIIGDDVFKNYEEAFSKIVRDSRWNEIHGTLLNRVNSENAIIIFVGYSWHPDDVFGRIKKSEIENDTPEHLRFEFLDFPVLNDDGTVLEGYPFSLEHVEQKRRESPVMFDAQYLMRPRSESAYMFDRKSVTMVDELPFEIDEDGNKVIVKPLRKVRYYDYAFKTKEASDYTATALIYKYKDRSILVHVDWWKLSVMDTIRKTKEYALKDGVETYIAGESNTGQDAIIQALQADTDLSNYTIRGIQTTTDKQVRAMPWILRANAGIFQFLRAEWNGRFFAIAEEFGVGAEIDDPIDAVSGAWQMAGDPIDGGYF